MYPVAILTVWKVPGLKCMLEQCSNLSNAFGGKRRFLNVAGSKLVTGLRAEGATYRLRELALDVLHVMLKASEVLVERRHEDFQRLG